MALLIHYLSHKGDVQSANLFIVQLEDGLKLIMMVQLEEPLVIRIVVVFLETVVGSPRDVLQSILV